VRKAFILLLSTTMVFGMTINEFAGNLAYAATEPVNAGGLDNKQTDKFKAEFSYEMAKITEKVMSSPTINIEKFKVEIAYATAQATAKVMPLLPTDQRTAFSYAMTQMTTKIINDPKLTVEQGKGEFAYDMAQLTTKIITNDTQTMVNFNKTAAGQKDIDPAMYTSLVDELMHVGDTGSQVDHKVQIDGEVRYHYATNSGDSQWDKTQSGIRAYVGLGTDINENWRINGMFDIEKSIINYTNKFELSRIYAVGKMGTSTLTAGSFGYLMAEGNIYDSGFKGARYDFGAPVKYSLSYGNTDYTQKAVIATARYTDYDYNLEAGLYHYRRDQNGSSQNTIRTLSGNYNFNDFSVGAMYLGSSLKDSKGQSNGYVLSLHYGELKTYRPGTYDLSWKYYHQPLGTYIEHGMNGVGNLGLMQGFKGYGVGIHYAFAKNLVAGLEYYHLADLVTGANGQTWWSEITYYF